MKILQVNKFYYRKGGADIHFLELSELLEKKGNKVVPFSMEHEKNFKTPYSNHFVSKVDLSKLSFTLPGFKAVGRFFYSFEAKKKIEELIKKEKPELVHIHNIYHQISPSILSVFKKYKIPVVMTVHDYKLICPNYKLFTKGKVCERCKKHKYWNAVFNKCLKNSVIASTIACKEMFFHKFLQVYEDGIDLYLTPSQFVKDKLVEWGFDGKKIKVLSHFVDLKEFQPSYENENYILCYGRLSSEKGIDVLIKAMKKVKTETKLKIVGSGPEEDKLKKQVKKSKLKNVEFLGYKEKSEVIDIVQRSKFVVMPSVWYEVFGLSILEPFALGKPVIGSNIGAIPELIKEGDTGLLFEPGNSSQLAKKIDELNSLPGEIVKMGENARKMVEKDFGVEDYYKKIERIYKNLLK